VTAGRTSGGWRPLFRPNGGAPARLFCLPHAGGGAVGFAGWGDGLPSFEVCPIELPGRLTRFLQDPIDRMGPLVELLADEIEPFLDRPYALFGHSLGGLVAFEIARRLAAVGAPPPLALLVAGIAPPHLVDDGRRLHLLPDDELAQELVVLGHTPPEVLAEPALLSVVLPIVRSDMAVIETYEHVPGDELSCPVVALGGADDTLVPPASLAGWSEHSRAGATVHVLPGGHFFPQEHPTALVRLIRAELCRIRGEGISHVHG
jgi:medium-chain acyl-[acyl-carrier-protein] hydrolase